MKPEASSPNPPEPSAHAGHAERVALALRICKLAAASLWAGMLIIAGLLLWPVHPTVAMCAIAGGQCVVMWLIADDLWPEARPELTGFCKLTAAMLFFGHLAAAVWLLWR